MSGDNGNKKQRIENRLSDLRATTNTGMERSSRNLALPVVPYVSSPHAPPAAAAHPQVRFPVSYPAPSAAAACFPTYPQMLPFGAPMGVFPNGMVPMNPGAVFQHPFSSPQQNGMNYNNFQPQLAPQQPPIVINNNTTNYNINANTVDLNASTQNVKGDVTVNRNTVTSNSQERSDHVTVNGSELHGNADDAKVACISDMNEIDASVDNVGESVAAGVGTDVDGTDGDNPPAVEVLQPSVENVRGIEERACQDTPVNEGAEGGNFARDQVLGDGNPPLKWNCRHCTTENESPSLVCQSCDSHINSGSPNPNAIAAFNAISNADSEGNDDVVVLDSEDDSAAPSPNADNAVNVVNNAAPEGDDAAVEGEGGGQDGDEGGNDDDCGVCMEPTPRIESYFTVCGHRFCGECYRKVMRTCRQCPICRRGLERRPNRSGVPRQGGFWSFGSDMM